MTTTELIELLAQHEKGRISHESREISLTINGKYMPDPQITISGTGDGICGAEIDLDVDGDFMEEQESKAKAFDVLRFVADNAGLTTFEAIEKAYNMGLSEQEPILDKIKAEISEAMDMEPAWKGQDNYIGGLQIACSIIDKYRQEG